MRVARDLIVTFITILQIQHYLDPSASKNEVSVDSSDKILQRDENVGKCRFDERYSMLYMFK